MENPPHSYRPVPVFALLLIGLGLILLLNNLGILHTQIWHTLGRFWPVLLILAGLQHLSRRSRTSGFLAFLSTLLIIGGVIILSIPDLSWGTKWKDYFNEETANTTLVTAANSWPFITSQDIQFNQGIGHSRIQDQPSSPLLLKLEAKQPVWMNPPELSSHSEQSSTLRSTINVGNHHGIYWWTDTADYTLTLAQSAIPTNLHLSIGAGSSDVELISKRIQQFNIELGAGNLTMSLNRLSLPSNESSLRIGAGSATIHLPKDIGLQIHPNVGLGNITLNGSNLAHNQTYTSTDFDNSLTKVVLSIEIGTGSVTIDQK